MRIPRDGLDREELFAKLERFRENDVRWRGGHAFAHVYEAAREAEEVAREAYSSFLNESGLDPTAFPSVQKLESEIIGMAVEHLRGGERATGNFTSGGTESIMLAVKSARDWARAERPEIREPEIVMPVTAHAAFHKSAEYLGMRLVTVEVDPETFRAIPEAIAEAITPNTVLLVASTPSWAHGVIDPIADVGRLAVERGLLFHVDGCIGAFLMPYFRRLGAPVPEVDFSVPGVTSISMDLHKYAFAPKGASLVMYRDKSLRRHQIFACTEWPGYTVVNPTVQSSKSGGPVAAAWAVLNYLGEAGYMELARRMLEGTRKLIAAIESIDALHIVGIPDFSIVAVASDEVSVFHVMDEMKLRGWELQGQLSFGSSPANIHFLITPANADNVDAMISDLGEAVEAARRFPPSELAATVGSMAGELDAGEMDESMFSQLMTMVGIDGARLPERMAEVNELLDAVPRDLCKEIVIEFFNELYMPPT